MKALDQGAPIIPHQQSPTSPIRDGYCKRILTRHYVPGFFQNPIKWDEEQTLGSCLNKHVKV
jgi:hypothetical protein